MTFLSSQFFIEDILTGKNEGNDKSMVKDAERKDPSCQDMKNSDRYP